MYENNIVTFSNMFNSLLELLLLSLLMADTRLGPMSVLLFVTKMKWKIIDSKNQRRKEKRVQGMHYLLAEGTELYTTYPYVRSVGCVSIHIRVVFNE